MRLIIPMAGEGKRLRPHTFTLPKPLFPLLGKPVLQWLIEEVQRALPGAVERMAFIVRDLKAEHRHFLEDLAENFGAAAHFCEQVEPLGTAHAIYQAREHLAGPCVILFADTIFRASIHVPADADGALWVKRVEDPRSYGVVELSSEGFIQRLIEKPEMPPSDLAIIGIYYLREAERLLPAIEYLFHHGIQSKGEYQLTDALQWLCSQGVKLRALPVEEWLDCGSKSLILQAQARLLDLRDGALPPTPPFKNVHIIPPCHIDEEAEISDAILGPYVVVERRAKIHRSIISRSLCRADSHIEESILHDAMIGVHAYCKRGVGSIDLGDYSRYG
ncbi:MAG: sugar phosphate nucleotidyltransferase [Bacteroidia bacterium]|nr:sugar phosphate nucleotidyltransferase [Bacteroidia bacterium]MCX7651962.1 sugar phosphate nucleotidyltransferase [Bacteroidia bacterium]MDW8416113.1 sugar phosphate nucleotidyltransferase [Bacteroidia bacterium]